MKLNSILLIVSLIGLIGCVTETNDDIAPPGAPAFSGEGYRPIYLSTEEFRQVSTEAPQALRKPGKIYVRGNYLFINELGKGIHLINNTNPAAPQKVSFIKIPGNVDIAVKGNLMYADNTRDFVVLNIADPTNVKVVKRIENAFPAQSYPPYRTIYFECVDESKGVVVGWEKVKMNRPKCYR
ncbi:hypothetical protein [Runella slithyformis]|uniref:LVIVD repeat protein n=1 Tax=Runella slithyformis (strain ATCC 29530 / DSM 19594 / LMG 11500 / NCIMB 11436 / LSU 4) TaxID=761193 RepID=A0A7U3ZPZ5_RUNSL|nr:hypothetical protein [Runella slithyformis]AEI51216.1 LVIVD repeat protein [Runella slithyformis DSM 19594]